MTTALDNTVFSFPYFSMTKTYLVFFYFILFVFFLFFLLGFYVPFKNIALIWSQSFMKGGRIPENLGKNHLTIRKQNLAFSHVTGARLKPQQ